MKSNLPYILLNFDLPHSFTSWLNLLFFHLLPLLCLTLSHPLSISLPLPHWLLYRSNVGRENLRLELGSEKEEGEREEDKGKEGVLEEREQGGGREGRGEGEGGGEEERRYPPTPPPRRRRMRLDDPPPTPPSTPSAGKNICLPLNFIMAHDWCCSLQDLYLQRVWRANQGLFWRYYNFPWFNHQ